MAMTLTQNRHLITAMNVTPLIDVLLVLLIIFMVITPTQPVGLGAVIPEPSPDQPRITGPDRTIVLQIDRALGITINSESTDLEHLGQRLADIFKARAERVVFVKADPDLEFGHVARAIDILKGAGIDTVGLLGRL